MLVGALTTNTVLTALDVAENELETLEGAAIFEQLTKLDAVLEDGATPTLPTGDGVVSLLVAIPIPWTPLLNPRGIMPDIAASTSNTPC